MPNPDTLKGGQGRTARDLVDAAIAVALAAFLMAALLALTVICT